MLIDGKTGKVIYSCFDCFYFRDVGTRSPVLLCDFTHKFLPFKVSVCDNFKEREEYKDNV